MNMNARFRPPSTNSQKKPPISTYANPYQPQTQSKQLNSASTIKSQPIRQPYSYLNQWNVSPMSYIPSSNYSRTEMMAPPDLRQKQSEPLKQEETRNKIERKTSFQMSTKSICGLRNIGNTCYMNSVLQCLFNTPGFNDCFLDGSYKRYLDGRNKNIANEYSSLVCRVKSSSGSENTSGLKMALGRFSSSFMGYDQQDSQEFMVTLLDGLSQDLNKIKSKPAYREMDDDLRNKSIEQLVREGKEWWEYSKSREDSHVLDYFQGQLINRVICEVCGHESLAFDTFQDISLSISRSLNKLEDITLERLIEHYNKMDQLDDAYCSRCKKHRKSKQKYSFWRLPKILVFHFKRFNFRRFSSDKLNHRIVFPINNLKVVEGDKKEVRYDLYGVVNHSGTMYGGHYTADCKNLSSEKWYRYNDAYVSELDIRNQGYDRYGSSSPYILFYCRQNS